MKKQEKPIEQDDAETVYSETDAETVCVEIDQETAERIIEENLTEGEREELEKIDKEIKRIQNIIKLFTVKSHLPEKLEELDTRSDEIVMECLQRGIERYLEENTHTEPEQNMGYDTETDQADLSRLTRATNQPPTQPTEENTSTSAREKERRTSNTRLSF